MTARFEHRRTLWLLVWTLVILLGVGLAGLAVYAYSYQGDPSLCPALQFGSCNPLAIYGLPLLSVGFLCVLWGSAYIVAILASRKRKAPL